MENEVRVDEETVALRGNVLQTPKMKRPKAGSQFPEDVWVHPSASFRSQS